MRSPRVAQRVFMSDPDLERAAANLIEDFGGAHRRLGFGACVVEQGRAREEERALRTEDVRVDRADGPARRPEHHHVAADAQRVEAFLERRFPDRIVDALDALAVGEPFDLGFEILLDVIDDLAAPGSAGYRALPRRRDRREAARAARLALLRKGEPDAARAG